MAALAIAAVVVAVRYRKTVAGRLQPTAAVVHTVQVRPGTIEKTIRLSGNTVAENSAILRAPYLRGRRSGRSGDFGLVLQKLAAHGARVRKGDTVAVFDRLAMLNRLNDFRASRVDAELRLKTMRADLRTKRAAYQQLIRQAGATVDQAALDLKTAPVRSAIQVTHFQLALDEARAAYRSLLAQAKYVEAGERADIRRLELELQEEQSEERRAEANLDRMVGRAPVDGVVFIREIFRGAEFGQIRAGDQVRRGHPYAQIVDPRVLIVEAKANQVDIQRFRIGARAHVRADAYRDLELPARVYSIGAFAKSSGWRASYVAEVPVFLKLDRMDARLLPNLTVSADVILGREQSQAVIPRAAVFRDAPGGPPFAYVKTPSGWEKRELELGFANYVAVAVDSGLSSGEVVAVTHPPV